MAGNNPQYYIKQIRLTPGGEAYLIKASVDGNGNDIVETYATKSSLGGILANWPVDANGVYILQASVVNGVATYTWILDTTLKTTEPEEE